MTAAQSIRLVGREGLSGQVIYEFAQDFAVGYEDRRAEVVALCCDCLQIECVRVRVLYVSSAPKSRKSLRTETMAVRTVNGARDA